MAASTMTRLQAHLEVKRLIKEVGQAGHEGNWSQVDTNNNLQAGLYKVTNDMPIEKLQEKYLVQQQTIFAATDNASCSFTLPTRYMRFCTLTVYPTGIAGLVYDAEYLNKSEYQQQKVNNYSSAVQTTTGEYFCTALRGNMFIIPQLSGSSIRADLEYLPEPAGPTTDVAVLDITKEGEQLVCLWIAQQAAIKKGDLNLAAWLSNQYDNRLAQLGVQGLTVRTEKAFPAGTEIAGRK